MDIWFMFNWQEPLTPPNPLALYNMSIRLLFFYFFFTKTWRRVLCFFQTTVVAVTADTVGNMTFVDLKIFTRLFLPKKKNKSICKTLFQEPVLKPVIEPEPVTVTQIAESMKGEKYLVESKRGLFVPRFFLVNQESWF